MCDAMKVLLPEFFGGNELISEENSRTGTEDEQRNASEDMSSSKSPGDDLDQSLPSNSHQVKLVRIQGIEPKLDIPFAWVVNNLMHPEHFLHISVCVKVSSADKI